MHVPERTPREQLEDLAYNLRWAWHEPTVSLFRELDPELWERLGQNPVALLRRLDAEIVEPHAPRIHSLWRDLREYLAAERTWYDRAGDAADRPLAAYFSAEFGITECLRIYSGGLGVLAGDHLKSASDLAVPLVAVGLLYREGYFQQEISAAGRQQERYPVVDYDDLPLRLVERDDGSPLTIAVAFPGRRVLARVWRADVGRVPLFLLDTDVPQNRQKDRGLTARLYGGDHETRISQEIVLGIGGYRALSAMGLRPRSFHMNEGHSAFLGLELVRDLMESDSLSFEEAIEEARSRCVFTTHTPVPAGHDRFSPVLMERYFTEHARSMGLELEHLLALGWEDDEDEDGPFTMTVLAINLAGQLNGVSRLHGAVSRVMWQGLWPEREVDEVPIGHITNGVHLPSWVHPDIEALYGAPAAELGTGGSDPDVDPTRLWEVHSRLRSRLVDYVRSRTGATLDPDALTIAFARRFATYKRATLLLRDEERLERLLGDADRPVQIVFAGKAHPRDEGGKALIRRIAELSREAPFGNRLVFVPGYDIDVARHLVQGADVWLNNPRRPMEASGTSGMKAAANGVLNVSILDGWWDEAWSAAAADGARIGWSIGEGAEAVGEEGDRADAEALFRVLEREVVPAFYDRSRDGFPGAWAERMRDAIRYVAPVFTTHRMVAEYVERYRRAAGSRAVGSRG